ncbi:MAG: DUF2339 domain-containing protein [Actinomycetota bacterium]
MVKNEDLYPRFDPRDSESEADLFGTWFARLGAIALLIGAAFGFKYAVDEGIIGPGLRVLLGVIAGLTMIAWGEWSQRKNWPRLGQAVSGGGIALLYLSIWSGFQLYELMSGTEAFTALTLVALIGGYLALRYESMALAVLSTIGGFGNAILIGEGFEDPAALFGYIVILDCVVLGLAYVRGWRALDHIALVATWTFFAAGALYAFLGAAFSGEDPQLGLHLGFATTYFLLFMSLAVARRATAPEGGSASSELILMVLNSGAYLIAVMTLLYDENAVAGITTEQLRGPVILVAAGVHLIAGLVLRGRNARDPMAGAALGSAIMLAAAWVPVQLEPFAVPAAWAVQGAALIVFADRTSLSQARFPGYVLLGLSVVYLTGLFADPLFYEPESVLLSQQSAAFAVHVGAFYVAATAMARIEDEGERVIRGLIAVMASIMTLVWLSSEAIAYFLPATTGDAVPSLHFTLTGIWGLYAAIVLAVGISARIAGARYLALAVFGVTLLKLTLNDVWTLDPLHRTLVFIGLGVIFLACSVMYHRFRDLILENNKETVAI